MLEIHRTKKPIMTGLTPSLGAAAVERLHWLLVAGAKEAVPAIRMVDGPLGN